MGIWKVRLMTHLICPAPFIHQSTKTDGSIKLCCRSLPRIGSVNDMTLTEAWNCDTIKQVRIDMINGVRNKHCEVCYKDEDAGVNSLRQKYLNKRSTKMLDEYQYAVDNMLPDGTLTTGVKWLELKLSNLCNFACRMCSVHDSTSWFKDWDKISDLQPKDWQDYIVELGLTKKPYLGYEDAFIEGLDLTEVLELNFAGGEPLFDEKHYKVLDKVLDRADEIFLSYATNLSMLKFKKYNILDYWSKFRAVKIAVSLDGNKIQNDYIRHGSNWKQIQENIAQLKQYTNIRIVAKITVQNTNVYYIPEALEWFDSMGIETEITFVRYPEHLSASVLPTSIKDKVVEKLIKYDYSCISSILAFVNQNEYTEELWNKFWKHHNALDKSRNESLVDIFPIFKNDSM